MVKDSTVIVKYEAVSNCSHRAESEDICAANTGQKMKNIVLRWRCWFSIAHRGLQQALHKQDDRDDPPAQAGAQVPGVEGMLTCHGVDYSQYYH